MIPRNRNKIILALYLTLGANINAKDVYGLTPFHYYLRQQIYLENRQDVALYYKQLEKNHNDLSKRAYASVMMINDKQTQLLHFMISKGG